MPLKKGKSQAVVSENISELHGGKTHAKTAKKFGTKKADKQSVAIALSQARKSGRKQARGAVPRHMRGRGMISEKALAAMGDKLAEQAAAPESAKGKKAKVARDTRPPAARNEPKPIYGENYRKSGPYGEFSGHGDTGVPLAERKLLARIPIIGATPSERAGQAKEAEDISAAVPRRKGD